jgi:hypothetical protein
MLNCSSSMKRIQTLLAASDMQARLEYVSNL